MKTVLYILGFCITALFVFPIKDTKKLHTNSLPKFLIDSQYSEELKIEIGEQKVVIDSLENLTRKNLGYFKSLEEQ